MSADLLRRAAAKLREAAKGATPGPWVHVDHGPPSGSFMGCGQVITEGSDVYGGDIAAPSGDLYPRGGYQPQGDMAFIALMHPPVALALADWLDEAAVHPRGFANQASAAAVARAVLREPEATP